MEKLAGLIAATYTPFDREGNLNLDLVPAYAAHLRRIGVRGVFVNGTTGEGLSLSTEERVLCAAAWVAQKSADFAVMIHVGHDSIVESCRLAAQAQRIGADGVGAMAPHFFKPADIASLVDFNREVAAAAPEIPYYYYHIPSMTGVHFPMIDFLALADGQIPNLAGIKYSHGDLMDMKLCLEYRDRHYNVLQGTDEILISGLAMGVRAAIGSTYNYIAPLFVRLLQTFRSGEMERAAQLQYQTIKIVRLLIEYGGAITAGKSFMRYLGLELGAPRSPVKALNPAEEKTLFRKLEALRFLDHCTPTASP